MATNKELLAQAVTAIPLWRAFLDKKEAEQDALLAEVRHEHEEESADTAENIPLSENTDFEAQTPVSEKQPPHEDEEKVAQAQPVEPKKLPPHEDFSDESPRKRGAEEDEDDDSDQFQDLFS